MSVKVAIYCRLSQEDRDKKFDNSESIINQEKLLTDYCFQNNYEIYKVYIDDDWSGMDRNRPSWNEMLLAAQNAKFNIILCKSQSRFSRDLEIVEKYLNGLFLEWGIRFISLVDNVDSSIKANRKQRQINGLANQWLVEDASDNIRAVLNSKRKQGLHIGGTARFGYLKDPNCKGKLIVDPIASTYIKKIFDLADKGLTTVAIAKILNNEKIPKATIYKQLYVKSNYKSAAMKSTMWNDKNVRDILREEMYIGTMVQGRSTKASIKSDKKISVNKEYWYIVKDRHEPIISKEQFYRIQNILNLKSRKQSATNIRSIFAGKLICGNCGSKLKKVKNGSQHYYYKCPNAFSPKYECPSEYQISHKNISYIVLDKIQYLINSYFDINSTNILKQKVEDDIYLEMKNKDIINLKLNRQSELLAKLYIDKTNNIVTDDEYLIIKKQIMSDRIAYEQEIMRIENNINTISSKQSRQDMLIQRAKEFRNITELNFEVLEAFVDYIIIYEKTPQQKVEIHWKI